MFLPNGRSFRRRCLRLLRGGVPLPLEPDALAAALPGAGARLLVLAHGLCMNDLQWMRKGHDHGASLAGDLGYSPVYLHYNTGGEKPDCVAKSSGDKKHKCRHFLHTRTETDTYDFINRAYTMFEIHGQKHETDKDPADNISHCELKKGPVSPVGKTRNAYEGQY